MPDNLKKMPRDTKKGAGAAASAKRRAWAEQEEKRMGRERRAHELHNCMAAADSVVVLF